MNTEHRDRGFVEVRTPVGVVMTPRSEFDNHWMIHFIQWLWRLFGLH